MLANLIQQLCVAQLTSESPHCGLLCLGSLASVQCQQSQVAPHLSLAVVHDIGLHESHISIVIVLQAKVGDAGAQPCRGTGPHRTGLLHQAAASAELAAGRDLSGHSVYSLGKKVLHYMHAAGIVNTSDKRCRRRHQASCRLFPRSSSCCAPSCMGVNKHTHIFEHADMCVHFKFSVKQEC